MSTPTLGITTQIGDSFNYQTTDPLGNDVQQLVNLTDTLQMQYGNSANTANTTTVTATKFTVKEYTITVASSILDIDLTALTDIFGNVLNFAHIYRMVIHNNDLNGGSGIIVKPAASNGWTGPWNGSTSGVNLVPAGGDLVFSAPYAGFNVNSGSKNLRLQNDAASPTGPIRVTLVIAGG